MSYLKSKKGSLESSILGIWNEAAKKQQEKLDPVNKAALAKDFQGRKDKDIDNDGDVDSTDKYLHKRRKAVSKAIAKESSYYNLQRAKALAKKDGLDYAHGTGHGVGFFLNVHEGPQAISRYNKVKLKKGMILSNEPGYYLNNKYGIRIENLVYIEKIRNNLIFKNLTIVPIDIDMINFGMLSSKERNYLFNYHLEIYTKISKYLNKDEKKWLIKLIK